MLVLLILRLSPRCGELELADELQSQRQKPRLSMRHTLELVLGTRHQLWTAGIRTYLPRLRDPALREGRENRGAGGIPKSAQQSQWNTLSQQRAAARGRPDAHFCQTDLANTWPLPSSDSKEETETLCATQISNADDSDITANAMQVLPVTGEVEFLVVGCMPNILVD